MHAMPRILCLAACGGGPEGRLRNTPARVTSLPADVTDDQGAVTHYGHTELSWDPLTQSVPLPAPVPAGGSIVLWYAEV